MATTATTSRSGSSAASTPPTPTTPPTASPSIRQALSIFKRAPSTTRSRRRPGGRQLAWPTGPSSATSRGLARSVSTRATRLPTPTATPSTTGATTSSSTAPARCPTGAVSSPPGSMEWTSMAVLRACISSGLAPAQASSFSRAPTSPRRCRATCSSAM